MAEVRKILGQSSLASATNTVVYTVPAATEAIVSTIFVANRGNANRTFRIAIVANGDTLGDKHYLYYDITLSRQSSFSFTTGITMGTGDRVYAWASGTNLSVNVFGVEIS